MATIVITEEELTSLRELVSIGQKIISRYETGAKGAKKKVLSPKNQEAANIVKMTKAQKVAYYMSKIK